MYIHELDNWPRMTWNRERIAEQLAPVRHQQGRLIGHMQALGFQLQQEALLQTLATDVIKTSEIEGEQLDKEQVRSSLARRLGVKIAALKPSQRSVDGVVEMMLDATRNYTEPLSSERLFTWQAALFPGGYSGTHKVRIGSWRVDASGPMQVVSGYIGNEKVHFEAPTAQRVNNEMRAFLKWFNANDGMDQILKAALAHLWFVTIHPFDDGNGRIARAMADLLLARSEGTSQRFYSMSAQIQQERSDYYDILELTQKGDLDITPWMQWFLNCLQRAIVSAQHTLSSVLSKAKFWESVASIPLNERQRMIVNRLIDGFSGKLTSSKYAKLAKCSQDTALRDIQSLVEHKILIRSDSSGRSTSYELKIS